MAVDATYAAPRVFSIPAGIDFLPTLVTAILEGRLGLGLTSKTRDLSELTIYVPTRRAARALSHAFADTARPKALLLPRILPLGDPFDLDERAILASASADMALVRPAISALDRRLRLASLVDAMRGSPAFRDLAKTADGFSIGERFQDSVRLAGDLAALIDDGQVESADWSLLDTAPLEGHDQYFAISLAFLKIITEHWPQVLAADGLIDPAERLNHLLLAEAKRLTDTRPDTPIIVAGSTGTVPATAKLMAAIARLTRGAVVLPGLDQHMDEDGWRAIAEDQEQEGLQPGHPQAALKRLIGVLGIERADVEVLGEKTTPMVARARILQAAHRAADATDDWPDLRQKMAADITVGLADVAVLEAPDERLEALAIATLLRETLTKGNQTAAVITPDRALAARVAAELRRWNIVADDSAGRPLADMPLPVQARLLVSCVLHPESNATLAAILQHPDTQALLHPNAEAAGVTADHLAQVIELAVLRTGQALPTLSELPNRIESASNTITDRHAARAQKRINPDFLVTAKAAVEALVAALAPLANGAAQRTVSDWAACHQAALDAVAGDRAGIGADAIALQKLLDEFRVVPSATMLTLADYQALFEMILREATVPPPEPVQGRIKIWGLLEARLLTADHVVLAGLNEGTWPPETQTDAFLNRGLRRHLGLSPPERRLGQTAHDFIQAMAAPQVTISRALQVEGSPSIASRFLRRLDAFAGIAQAKAMRTRAQNYLDYAAELDGRPGSTAAAKRPDPRPESALHPQRLSITEIRTLYRDPYAIYAKHVLKLDAVPSLDPLLDSRDRGMLVHEAVARFIADIGADWPDDALARLHKIGDVVFEPYAQEERVQAFWKPVFEAVAKWFVGMESGRWADTRMAFTEKKARLPLALADGNPFVLSGQIDRIDMLHSGSLRVTDYKTGAPPSVRQIANGIEPQLTLSAAMVAKGAVEDVPAGEVASVEYIQLGRNPKHAPIAFDTGEAVEAVAARHIMALTITLNRLRSKEAGYLSRRMPFKQDEIGDYDHLARVAEWAQAEEE